MLLPLDGTVAPAARRHATEVQQALDERFGLAAPELVAWETANVVHHKHRTAFGPDLAARTEVVRLLLDGVDLVQVTPSALAAAAGLAERHDLASYDAAYLELASRHPASILLTEDGALLKAARQALGDRRAFTTGLAHAALEAGAL